MSKLQEQGLGTSSIAFDAYKTSEGKDFWTTVRREETVLGAHVYYQEHYPFRLKPNSCYPEQYYVVIDKSADLPEKVLPIVVRKTHNMMDNKFHVLYESTPNIEESYIRVGTLNSRTTLRAATTLEITLFKAINRNGARRAQRIASTGDWY